MIESLATAAGALNEPRYLAAATKAADFLLSRMRQPGDEAGRLLHAWRAGQAKFDAYLDDYACFTNALVTLYEAGFVEKYIDEAVRIADAVLEHFPDRDRGGFFYTADDHEELIARQKDIQDNPVPSGNGMIAHALLRLGKLTGRDDFLRAAEATLTAFSAHMTRIPSATAQMLLALDLHLGPTYEVVIVGEGRSDAAELLAALRRRYVPRMVLAFRETSNGSAVSTALSGLLEGKSALEGQPTVYICQNFACQTPVVGRQAIRAAWQKMAE